MFATRVFALSSNRKSGEKKANSGMNTRKDIGKVKYSTDAAVMINVPRARRIFPTIKALSSLCSHIPALTEVLCNHFPYRVSSKRSVKLKVGVRKVSSANPSIVFEFASIYANDFARALRFECRSIRRISKKNIEAIESEISASDTSSRDIMRGSSLIF